ncbi:helix-turn-helix protein [Murinocardiopsis flavida]|uniref:Helix-turn-helix protein n=1 Tax=Murinocardiopsis flavida TaxID=645275 RepID=A0A2P8D128_9ACTN|nr:helix-turn-helix transcriptional regulator [Murinocardiopsis flavida]PSK90923.1 helix-turn-helix protein [Murinocardiopsis flavida]
MGNGQRPQWVPYGVEVRRLRVNMGLSQANMAKQLHISSPAVSSFENATRVPRRQTAEALDSVLSADGSLMRLWVETSNVEAYPSWMADLVEAEPVATFIREHQLALIPGLIQTEDYARAIYEAGNPLSSTEEIERLVEMRMKRQAVLTQSAPPTLWYVLDYAAVARPVGGPTVMAEQLARLIELAEQRRAHFQVIPLDYPRHPDLTSSFKILSFKDKPDVMYTESRSQGTMSHDSKEVSEMSVIFGSLQSAALTEPATLDLLHQIRRDFNGT